MEASETLAHKDHSNLTEMHNNYGLWVCYFKWVMVLLV